MMIRSKKLIKKKAGKKPTTQNTQENCSPWCSINTKSVPKEDCTWGSKEGLYFSRVGAKTITDKPYPVKVVKTKSENKEDEEKEKKIPSQPVFIHYQSNRSESSM